MEKFVPKNDLSPDEVTIYQFVLVVPQTTGVNQHLRLLARHKYFILHSFTRLLGGKKSIPSGCRQKRNPNNRGGIEIILCRHPQQKQMVWTLMPDPSAHFKKHDKVNPPSIFPEDGCPNLQRNRISAGIIRVPQVASWNQPALASNDQACKPARQLLMRCP